MPTRAECFEYAVSVDSDGSARAEDSARLEVPDSWTPEHLLLAGLVRCTLKSLRFHGRAGISVSGGGEASGVVTRRDDDGRYGLVEALCGLDVELDPLPDEQALRELPAKAQRDCFVGASLRVSTQYEWRVNRRVVGR